MTSSGRLFSPPPAALTAAGRVIVGVIVIGVLTCAYLLGIPAGRADPFDYFGYFTNLTSLLAAIVLIATGATVLTRGSAPAWLHLARGAAVAAMLVVALVYNLVVPGTGTAPLWVSIVLHIAFPVLLLLDWLLVLDRPPLPWNQIWVVLPYPLLWLGITLIRGVADGWVPYGFLLPSRGAAQLASTVGMLLAALLVSAAVVWAMSRRQRPGTAAETPGEASGESRVRSPK